MIGLIKNLNFEIGYWICVGFLLAVAYMTNAWDGAIYFLLAFFVILYLKSQDKIHYKLIITASAIILIAFFIFVTPYNMHFKPFVFGIGVLCSPDFLVTMEKFGPFIFAADHCQHSPWWQLLILY